LKSLKTVQAGACRQAIAIALAVRAVGLVGAPATAAEGSSVGHGEGGYVLDFVSIIEEFHRLQREINVWLAAKGHSKASSYGWIENPLQWRSFPNDPSWLWITTVSRGQLPDPLSAV
jgi:hypothetical protein